MSRRKKPAGRPDVKQMLESLAAEEAEFVRREFLAPAVDGGAVRVRIAGAVCQIDVEPRDFVGWGIFQPTSHRHARLVRPASLLERRRYLELFPLVRLIVCRRTADGWFGSAASFGDHRVQLTGLAPLLLVDEVQLFDCVNTRYDGTSFWFDEVDPRHDPATAAFLRRELAVRTVPDQLKRKGLSAEHRAAYEVNLWETLGGARAQRGRRGEQPQPVDEVARQLQANLSHAGARLVEYLERGDSLRVTYSVGGRRYTSSIDKRTLTVQVAGICLAGQDHKFDLASLVGVLREGEGEDIVRVGDDADLGEEDYWQLHPRRP